jgi:hypothetical protein
MSNHEACLMVSRVRPSRLRERRTSQESDGWLSTGRG